MGRSEGVESNPDTIYYSITTVLPFSVLRFIFDSGPKNCLEDCIDCIDYSMFKVD